MPTQNYIKKKGYIDRKCSSCGHSWSFFFVVEANYLSVVGEGGGEAYGKLDADFNRILSYDNIICEQCGHLCEEALYKNFPQGFRVKFLEILNPSHKWLSGFFLSMWVGFLAAVVGIILLSSRQVTVILGISVLAVLVFIREAIKTNHLAQEAYAWIETAPEKDLESLVICSNKSGKFSANSSANNSVNKKGETIIPLNQIRSWASEIIKYAKKDT